MPIVPVPCDCGGDGTPCPPVSSTGLCLADGTPIAVIYTRDCDTGVVVQQGWTNLLTGVFTPGAPPAGTRACGERLDFELTKWCDLNPDGTVIAHVLVEYEYDEETGQLIGTRLLTLLGAEYNGGNGPVGTLGACGNADEVFQHQEVLCDHRAGAGDPVPTSPGAVAGTAVFPTAAQHNMGGPVNIPLATTQQLWNGQPINVGPDADNTHVYAAATVAVDPACGDLDPAGTSSVTATVRITNTGSQCGCGLWGQFGVWDGNVLVAFDNLGVLSQAATDSICPGQVVTAVIPATAVSNAAILAGTVRLVLNVQTGADNTFDGIGCPQNTLGVGTTYTLDQFSASAVAAVVGCTGDAEPGPVVPFIRKYIENAAGLVIDTVDLTFDGMTYNVEGVVGRCLPDDPETTFGLQLCDVLPDGTVVPFVRTYTVNCGEIVQSCDHDLGGVDEYEPVGTVGPCPVSVTLDPAGECENCETLQLCDQLDPTVDIVATDARWTLTGTVTPSPGEPGGPAFVFGGDLPVTGVATFDPATLVPGKSYTMTWEDTWNGAGGGGFGHPFPAGSMDAKYTVDVLDGAAVVGTSGQINITNGTVAAGGPWVPRSLTFTAPADGNVSLRVTDQSDAFDASGLNNRDIRWRPRLVEAAAGQDLSEFSVPFLRRICRDCEGVITAASGDTELDGQTQYIIQGTVVSCSTATGGTASSDCENCETIQLCDVVTPTDVPTPGADFTLTGNVTLDGLGRFIYSLGETPVTGVASGVFTVVPGASYDLTFSAGYQGTGNPPGVPQAIYLAEVIDGATVIATSGDVNITPAGGAIQPQPAVSFVGPASGVVTIQFTDHTTDGGQTRDLAILPESLIATGETAEAVATPFLRTICRDCDGVIVGTPTDTGIDGVTPYDVTGVVGSCSGSGSGASGVYHGEFVLCDDNGSYIRKLVQNADGSVVGTPINMTLDGAPYIPVGISRPCSDCRQVVTAELCDPGLGAINTYTSTTPKVQPGQLPAVPPPGQHFWSIDPAPLFAGGAIDLPGWATNPPSNRWQDIQGTILPTNPAPCGPPDQVVVTVRARYTSTAGGGGATGIDVLWQLRNGTTVLASDDESNMDAGSIGNMVASATVNWTDLVAGNINVIGFGKVHQASLLSTWYRVDNYSVTIEDVDPIPGCSATGGPTRYLQHRVLDCSTGMQVSEFTTTLDGQPYDVVGTPEVCDVAPGCVDCELVELADSTPQTVRGVVTNVDPTPWLPTMAGSQAIVAPATAQAVWNGGIGSVPSQVVQGRHSMAVGRLSLACPPCGNPATVNVAATIRVRNDGPVNSTEAVYGRFALWNGLTYVAGPNLNVPALAPGQSFTAVIPATDVALADLLAGRIYLEWNVETNGDTNTPKNWTVDQFAVTLVAAGSPGCGKRFLRKVCYDCDGNQLPDVFDTTDGVTVYVPVGAVATPSGNPPCAGGSASGTQELDRFVQPLCDYVNAFGATTPFLRHWAIDNTTGALTLIGNTTLDGTTAYNVQGIVTVCGQNNADAILNTGVRRVAGVAGQFLKTEFQGLQSVTLTVLAGTVLVTMTSGLNQQVPAGVSLTWSTNDVDDSALQVATFTGSAAEADYLLNWTYKVGGGG